MPKLSAGFTLVELMVVISIMAILTVVAYINVGSFRQDQELVTMTADLQNFIRLAQTNATTNLQCEGSPGADWIVEFKKEFSVIALKCSLSETDIKIMPHKDNIIIKSIQDSENCFPTRIRFSPLFGMVAFETDSLGCFNSDIQTLSLEIFNETNMTSKTIVINKGGSIYDQ